MRKSGIVFVAMLVVFGLLLASPAALLAAEHGGEEHGGEAVAEASDADVLNEAATALEAAGNADLAAKVRAIAEKLQG